MLRQDVPIKAMLCRQAAKKKLPVSGSFELTPRCSLNCKMCYIRMSAAEMKALGRERTVQEWLDLAQQAKDAGLVFLLLTGGEPLVYPEFKTLYRELSKMGLSIDINTNATLIDAEMVEFFREAPPAKFNITLYGTGCDSYERLCGDGSAYKKVVRAIDMLTKAGMLVSLNATITPENVSDTEEIARFAKERGLNLKLTSLVVPPYRRGKVEAPHRLSAKHAGEAAAKGHFIYFDEDAIRQKLASLASGAAPFSLLDDCAIVDETGTRCLAGNSQFWITWNGEMYPCCMMPWVTSHPFEAGFVPAWEQIVRKTAALPQSPHCTKCSLSPICPSCAALQFCETGGEVQVRPDYLCQMAQAYRDTLQHLSETAAL